MEHILLFAFAKTYQTPCYYILLPVIEKFLESLKILGTVMQFFTQVCGKSSSLLIITLQI